MLRFARILLIGLDIANWLAVLFFAVMATLLLLGLPPASAHAAQAALPGHISEMTRWMLAMFAVGIATGVAVDRIFRPLLRILATVIEGRPFTRANGDRLRRMAWALLAIQLLDLVFAWIVRGINQVARHAPFGWSPSATGWIAVLLLFVLAQVFVQGAAMQDDLEGTV
jgi:hypothetical protein